MSTVFVSHAQNGRCFPHFFWRQLRDVFEVARLRYARYEHCLGELGFHAMTSQLSLQLLSKTLAANDTVFEVGSVAQEAHVKQVEKNARRLFLMLLDRIMEFGKESRQVW